MTTKKFVQLWGAAFLGDTIASFVFYNVDPQGALRGFFTWIMLALLAIAAIALPILFLKGLVVIHRDREADRVRAVLAMQQPPPARAVPVPAMSIPATSLQPYYVREFARLRNGEQGRFNVAACVFGALWCAYRGLWLTAIAGIVAVVVTGGIAAPFVWLAYGFRGNYLYFCLMERGEQRVL
jgi:hypothetical protein